MRLMEYASYEPACFVESGGRLKPDFANVQLGKIVQFVTTLRAESELGSFEEVAASVNDLKVRVAALDSAQVLQRGTLDELINQIDLTSARNLEDHDEAINRRNEHKIVIHGLKRLNAANRIEMKAAALREVTRLFQEMFPSGQYTIVQVCYHC